MYRKLVAEHARISGVINKKEGKLAEAGQDENGRVRLQKEIGKQRAKLVEIDKELGEMAESG
jgi:hypothetical protein